ncbi:MAG: amidohydrolase family protein [Phycisphaerales bacterium]|nr:amidohydrolase family protein [Phycisphaerales bacterium]
MKMSTLRSAVGLIAMAVVGVTAWAQTSGSPLAPPANGVRQTQPADGLVALTGATVHAAPGKIIENATLVVRDGKIVSVMSGAPAPAGAPVRELRDMHIYAGFIEPMVQVDVPAPDANAPGTHWNARVTPQRSALQAGAAGIDAKESRQLREMGFVAAAISPKGGIFHGAGAVVSLAERPSDPSLRQPTVYRERAFHAVSFETSREEEGGTQGRGPGDDPKWSRYPDSQMGAIAVIRQTLSDADWKQNAARSGADPTDALDALRRVQPEGKAHDPGTLLFDVDDELEVLRAAKIASEFKRPAVVFGSGMEFRRLEAIKGAGVGLIVPLAAPDAPKVATLGERESVELRELMNWELAPTNAARLDAAGIRVALSSAKIPEKRGGRKAFQERLSNAIKHGLSADRALAMLTVNPAEMLGVSDRLGSIEPGKAASFVVADGPLLVDRPDAPDRGEPGYARAGRIVDVWIDGSRHAVGERRRHDLSGTWSVELTPAPPGNDTRTIEINDAWPPEVTITKMTAGEKEPVKVKAAEVRMSGDADGGEPSRISWVFQHEPFGSPGVFAVDGVIERGADGVLVLRGRLTRAGGDSSVLIARRTAEIAVDPEDALAGTWTQVVGGKPRRPMDAQSFHLVINPNADRKVKVKRGDKELESTLQVFDAGTSTKPGRIVLNVKGLDSGEPESERLVTIDQRRALGTQGEGLKINLIDLTVSKADLGENRSEFARYRPTPEADAIAQIPAKLSLPVGPYGFEQLPKQGTFIIRNATVWTLAGAGTLKDAGVVISGGKIAAVGDSAAINDWLSRVRLSEPPVEIDATGKHVAPGIVDCHSHTGISKGVNESGQSVTSEVRIGDVTDPDSISWYRQLAGGVTAVNNLHGSANTIGGQNQVNKIRWGCVAPDDMHFEGAIPGIKFALGENVKQSNWGDRFNTRYPQTRMGVEMLLRDRFTAAREYMQARAMDAGKNVVRRDLELDALAEILRGERLVHCHSYRQDEILMLCRVAKDFGFLIGTFQHGLEVYKVADEVKAAAIGASLFSDWWTFKVEVQDAIPMAGPLQHELGLTTSYNSDSDELARRMNVEAGKAIKYSGGNGVKMSPEDALKFVTLNPAKQLRVDDRVGTIEAGKDADLAIWSGPPMSSLSRCERTFVDGREMFSLEMDRTLRERNAKERARIIQKLLTAAAPAKGEAEKSRGGDSEVVDTPKTPPRADQPWDMRSGRRSLLADMYTGAADRRREHFVNMLRRGLDPRFHGAGVCGCENW